MTSGDSPSITRTRLKDISRVLKEGEGGREGGRERGREGRREGREGGREGGKVTEWTAMRGRCTGGKVKLLPTGMVGTHVITTHTMCQIHIHTERGGNYRTQQLQQHSLPACWSVCLSVCLYSLQLSEVSHCMYCPKLVVIHIQFCQGCQSSQEVDVLQEVLTQGKHLLRGGEGGVGERRGEVR